MTENLETDVSHSGNVSVVSTFETSYRTVIALRRHEKRKQLLPKRHSKTHMMHRVVGPVVVAFCIFANLNSLRASAQLSATTTAANENRCCPRRADYLIVVNQHQLEDIYNIYIIARAIRPLRDFSQATSLLQVFYNHGHPTNK